MVLEQYTLPGKYNFPQPSTDTTLPQRFLEQSLTTLKQVQHQPPQLNSKIPQLGITDQYSPTIQIKPVPITLKANRQETIIAAVDSSTIKIGETNAGIIVAVRGATTWRQNRTYRYTRLGPFVFHLTEENKNQLYSSLEKSYFGVNFSHLAAPNVEQMPLRLAGLLERWQQTMLAKTLKDGVLLMDGSLTAGTVDTPAQRLKEILNYARRNQTTVLAFSKATTLRANGLLITEQLPNENPPYLLETAGLHAKLPQVQLGDVYVARLNSMHLAFRVDIDRETDFSQRLDGFQRLLGNDITTQSYPETLRLAHILCTFTANEILAIKHFVTRKYGIQMVNRPDMHRLLFGPFGRGEVYA